MLYSLIHTLSLCLPLTLSLSLYLSLVIPLFLSSLSPSFSLSDTYTPKGLASDGEQTSGEGEGEGERERERWRDTETGLQPPTHSPRRCNIELFISDFSSPVERKRRN